MFNQRDVRKVFFKSFYRPAIIVPENFEIADLEEDDLYPGYRKLEMNLALPPGSFATMLVKGLTV
jgi:tRNA pseudouridine13 synthase